MPVATFVSLTVRAPAAWPNVKVFPKKYLHYYHAGEDERILLQRLHPEAILIKESGLSGGFNEKVEAALQEGIRIFAIRRPPMPGSFMIVNGEHGLRRMIEKHLPDFTLCVVV